MPERSVRLILAVLAATSAVVGFWAGLAPRSFYDDFPGGGRQWVAVDGPFNEHLVRDVGTLNLALALVAAAAAMTLVPALVRVSAAALLVNAVPHLGYHLQHLELYSVADQVANLVSLGLAVALPLVVLVVSRERRRSASNSREMRR